MSDEPIKPGDRVIITDAKGVEHECEALSERKMGHSMAVVWVNVPLYAGGFDPTPWPAEFVRPVRDV